MLVFLLKILSSGIYKRAISILFRASKFVFICKSAIPSRYFMVKEGETSVSLCNVENYKKVK